MQPLPGTLRTGSDPQTQAPQDATPPVVVLAMPEAIAPAVVLPEAVAEAPAPAPAPAHDTVVLTDLAKRYGEAVVFQNVSLRVHPGEFVAIVGESGVGKSTLLNCMAGLDSWDHGSVVLDGQDLGTLDGTGRALLRRAKVGFVFQAFHVLPHLDVAQNIALPLMLLRDARSLQAEAEAQANAHRLTQTGALNAARLGATVSADMPNSSGIKRWLSGLSAAFSRRDRIDWAQDPRVQAMLTAVGLEGLGARLPQQLSGGQLQRVAIARALIHRPALVLADEPTGNLDPDTAAKVMDVLCTQAREHGSAIVLVTHSQAAAARADRRCKLRADGIEG